MCEAFIEITRFCRNQKQVYKRLWNGAYPLQFLLEGFAEVHYDSHQDICLNQNARSKMQVTKYFQEV